MDDRIVIYKNQEYESIAALMEALTNDNVIEISDWAITDRAAFKVYDAGDFVEAANCYANQSVPDLIQASRKMWLAVVYVIKEFFLEIDFAVESHRSLGICCNLATDCESVDRDTSFLLRSGWKAAQKLHSLSYGFMHSTKNEFLKRQNKVNFFLANFPNIKRDEVKSKANLLLEQIKANDRTDINFRQIKEDEPMPELKGRQYFPTRVFY